MVGPRIRELRMERALSQDELALRAGLSSSALIRIEGGQARPRPTTLRKLAEALAVDVGELTAELRDMLPCASEDEVPPLEELRQLDTTDSLATLQARDALQRVAEDVLAGLEPRDPHLPEHLTSLAQAGRQLSGPLAAHGQALATFLEALRDEEIEVQHSASPEEARAAVQALSTAVRAHQADWEAAYREVCHSYAALLLRGEPRAFHDAVGTFLLKRAELTLAELAAAEPRGDAAAAARRAVTALATILSLFDLANGARMGARSAVREGSRSNVLR